MKRIDEILPHHIEIMDRTRKEWIDRAHSCQCDKKALKSGVKFVYGLCGKPVPKIVFCGSPMSARLTIHILRTMKFPASVGASVRDSVGASVGASVRASVWDSVGASVRASVWASVWDSVGEITPDYYCNFGDFGWTAFYRAFREMGLNIPIGWEKFDLWAAFMAGNPFETYSFEKICFVVLPPTKIVKNEAGLLHNPQGAAIEFADGYQQFYINGRNLPAWIWEQRDAITKDQFLKEKNAEIRGGMYAVLGQKKVFDLIGAGEICRKHANDETYILYRTHEKVGEKYWQWVGVTCPSTQTNYLLGVPETVTCPIEAVASTWGLSSKEYIINQHT